MRKKLNNIVSSFNGNSVKRSGVLNYSELNSSVGYALCKSESIALKSSVISEMDEIKKEYKKERLYIFR